MMNLDEWVENAAEVRRGTLQNSRYELSAASPIITVRNAVTGVLEAYSSTWADFRLSLDEFAHDFFEDEE